MREIWNFQVSDVPPGGILCAARRYWVASGVWHAQWVGVCSGESLILVWVLGN